MKIFFVFIPFISIISCNKIKKSSRLTFADSIWVNFSKHLENKNLAFLIENSLDTIQCVDCEILPFKENEYYKAKFIFNNRIEKLKYLKTFKDIEFSTFEEDSIIYVNYSFPETFTQEYGYNLIFIFKKVKNRYLFAGKILT